MCFDSMLNECELIHFSFFHMPIYHHYLIISLTVIATVLQLGALESNLQGVPFWEIITV